MQTEPGGHGFLAGEPGEQDQRVRQLRVDGTGGPQAHRHGAIQTDIEGGTARRDADGRVRVRVFPDAAHRGVPAGVGVVAREIGPRRVRSAERAAVGPVAPARPVVAVELRPVDPVRSAGPLSARRRAGRLLRRAVRAAGGQQTHDGAFTVRQSGAGRQEPNDSQKGESSVEKLEGGRGQFQYQDRLDRNRISSSQAVINSIYCLELGYYNRQSHSTV